MCLHRRPLKTKLVVAGATVQFCCENCLGKAMKFQGDDQLVALFGGAAYEKGGFKVAAAKNECAK